MEILFQVAKVDEELARVRASLDAGPARVAEAERALAAAEEAAVSFRGKAQAARAEGDRLNLEIKSAEAERAKRLGQLNVAKSNAEYSAIQKQIEEIAARVGRLEEEALGRYEAGDASAAESREAESGKKDADAKLAGVREEVAAERAGLEEERKDFEARRADLLARLEPEDRALYENVLARRGSALALVTDEYVCTACHMSVPPQVYNLVLLGRRIQHCASCGRILYAESAARAGGPAQSP